MCINIAIATDVQLQRGNVRNVIGEWKWWNKQAIDVEQFKGEIDTPNAQVKCATDRRVFYNIIATTFKSYSKYDKQEQEVLEYGGDSTTTPFYGTQTQGKKNLLFETQALPFFK